MELIDSHCHLDMLDTESHGYQLNGVLEEAHADFVKHLLCVSIHPDRFPMMYNLIRNKPNVYASIGLHPNEFYHKPLSVDTLLAYAELERVIAIGETGLDFYRHTVQPSEQIKRFEIHIEASIKSQKPIIVHTRAAKEETIYCLKNGQADKVGGVFHCFTEDLAMAQKGLELGFYISFSGILTFKNAQSLRDVAKAIPLHRILIETDSPYLTPMPHRGKPNAPKYVRYVAECLADLHKTSVEEVAKQTTNNFFNCFKGART